MGVPETFTSFIIKLPMLFLGYFMCGLGVVMNLYANLGTDPWGILHIGFSNVTSLKLGQISQLVGLVLVLSCWILGVSPGFGTLANMIFFGLFIDLIIESNIVPLQHFFLGQISQLLASIAIIGLGVFLYLRTQLGASPRDGLMVALTKISNKPIVLVRISLDLTVSLIGYLLGGPLGLGSILSALGLGYFINSFLNWEDLMVNPNNLIWLSFFDY